MRTWHCRKISGASLIAGRAQVTVVLFWEENVSSSNTLLSQGSMSNNCGWGSIQWWRKSHTNKRLNSRNQNSIFAFINFLQVSFHSDEWENMGRDANEVTVQREQKTCIMGIEHCEASGWGVAKLLRRNAGWWKKEKLFLVSIMHPLSYRCRKGVGGCWVDGQMRFSQIGCLLHQAMPCVVESGMNG